MKIEMNTQRKKIQRKMDWNKGAKKGEIWRKNERLNIMCLFVCSLFNDAFSETQTVGL
jgi:hypothetical protein